MLSKISWSEFIWFLVYLLIPYYVCIITAFFRIEVFAFMRNPGLRSKSGFVAAAPGSDAGPFNSPQILPAASSQDDISLSVIHDLLEDLKKVFAVASKTKMVKEELVQAICSKLKSYSHLNESDHQEDISNHIKIEVKTICGIVLDATDLKQFWNT